MYIFGWAKQLSWLREEREREKECESQSVAHKVNWLEET